MKIQLSSTMMGSATCGPVLCMSGPSVFIGAYDCLRCLKTTGEYDSVRCLFKSGVCMFICLFIFPGVCM